MRGIALRCSTRDRMIRISGRFLESRCDIQKTRLFNSKLLNSSKDFGSRWADDSFEEFNSFEFV
jgi:hypothetical protein